MTLEELCERLKELENTRSLAQAELEVLASREERVKELERNRNIHLGLGWACCRNVWKI